MTKQISSNHFIPYLCNMKKHLTFKSQQLSTIFWLLIAGTFWIQFLNMSTSICEATFLTICISGSYMLVNQYLCNHLLKKAIRTKQMKPFWILFIVLCIPTSTLVASYFVLFQYLEQTGIFPVSNIFIEGEENLLFNSILLLPGTLVINLAFCGLCFYSENLQLEKEKSQFLFQTLRQQITPHFMFNVLNHINILMQDNVPLASSLLEKYSDILRYQLYNGQKELISLEQEIEFLQNYIAIENIRWEDKLAVSTEWEVEDGNIGFPPLLLLTFIENAFKHASHTPTEKGQVQIRFKQNAHHILLEVGNTSSPHLQRPGTGLGLANAIKRLDIQFHKKYQLSVNQTDTYYQTSLSIEI